MHCRYCDKPIPPGTEAITHSYWQGLKFFCHTECKQAGERTEAIECQTVDADCNDCAHFQRGQIGRNKSVWYGHCLKFARPTLAFPKKWTGRECFEHRRAREAAEESE